MTNLKLETSNPFARNFDQFQNDRLTERLQKKFTPKPYHVRFNLLRIVALISSYVFNLFSGLTASVLVLFFTYQVSGYWIPSLIVTVLFLVLLEISKRITTTTIFKDALVYKKMNFGLCAVALILIGISILFSYNGSKYAIKEFTPPPALVNLDSLTAPIDQRITNLEQQREDARNTKYRGVTTSSSQRTVETLTQQIATLENERMVLITKTRNKNENKEKTHDEHIQLNGSHFALVTGFLELLFLLCTFYLEYFDFRSFVEIVQPSKSNDNGEVETLPQQQRNKSNINGNGNITDDNVLKKAVQKAQKNYNAFKSKFINNNGNRDTNLEGMDRWNNEVDRLKGLQVKRNETMVRN